MLEQNVNASISSDWNKLRYGEVQRQLHAAPVFTSLKINPQLTAKTPSWCSSEHLVKADYTLGPTTSSSVRIGSLENTGWASYLKDWTADGIALLQSAWRKSSLKTYHSAWTRWCRWAKTNNVDHNNPGANELARFMCFLHTELKLAPSTILIHKSVVCTFANAEKSGKTVGASASTIRGWIRAAFQTIGIGSPPGSTRAAVASYNCSVNKHSIEEILAKGNWRSHIIMEKMINDARAMWVVQPGKDDFFLHDVYKKYNVREDPKSLDPRYHIRERCFPRSYRLELDCIERARLEKLHKKCVREHDDFENYFQYLVERQKRKEKPRIRVLPCKRKSPKWWKYLEKEKESTQETIEYKTPEVDETTYAVSYERWQEEPNLTAFVEDDPCRRKMDMLL
nr:unnamed protein product [Callosobruchus analis]